MGSELGSSIVRHVESSFAASSATPEASRAFQSNGTRANTNVYALAVSSAALNEQHSQLLAETLTVELPGVGQYCSYKLHSILSNDLDVQSSS